jgi:CHAT domain-containing protein
VDAIGEWSRAKTIYLAIDDDDAAVTQDMKQAWFWDYLNRTDIQLKLLDSASSRKIGSISYEVKGREWAAVIPQITYNWHIGSYSVSGEVFRPFGFSDDLGEIKATMAQASIEAQLSLADHYGRLGRWANVAKIEERVLKQNRPDTNLGLVARLLFTTRRLDSSRAAKAIPPLREILRTSQKRFRELWKQLPTADVALDLSSGEFSVKVKQSVSIKPKESIALPFRVVYDIKAVAQIEVLTMYLLGKAQALAGKNKEAIDTLLEAAAQSEKYKDWIVAAQSHYALGLLFQNSDYDRGVEHLLRARELTHDTLVKEDLFSGGESTTAVQIREALGRLYYDRREWKTAVKYDWEAAKAYESIRTELSIHDLQQPLMHRLSQVYERLVAATLPGSSGLEATASDPEAIAQAFWYAESAKSRALLDVMGIAHQTHSRNPSTELANAEEQLRQQIETTTAKADALRRGEGRSVRVELLEERLDQMRRDYEKLQIDKRVAEAQRGFRESLKPLPAAKLRERLAVLNRSRGQETVLISFFVAKDRTYVWMVSESGIELDTIPVSATDLERQVEKFIRTIDEPVMATRESDPLYSLLFGKFRDRIANKRLGIAPHGILHRLPFNVLRYDGAYLIQRSSLFYLPSASLLPYLLDRHSDRPATALVLADPDGTLDYSLLEATKIAEVLGEGKVEVRTGAGADRGTFKQLQGNYSILHLATHGNFNSRFPILSGMILSDGQLLLSDVANLNGLGADLVVLSACNTGESKIESGDELIGLAGAFMRAGASSILVSLWRAQDDSTPVFIERFYRHMIVDRMPRDLAVQEAQRSMIKDGYPPISWGGFLLVGSLQ